MPTCLYRGTLDLMTVNSTINNIVLIRPPPELLAPPTSLSLSTNIYFTFKSRM